VDQQFPGARQDMLVFVTEAQFSSQGMHLGIVTGFATQ
jgi:hypothetical protein